MTHHPEGHHEVSDVDIRPILAFAGGLIAVVVVVSLLVTLLFKLLDARKAREQTNQFPLAAGQQARLPPEPRLQTNPRQDLLELRRQEQAVLTTYGWVDQKAGIVRMPITEAMRLTVQRGLPARQGHQ
jgi:hypothetical protein